MNGIYIEHWCGGQIIILPDGQGGHLPLVSLVDLVAELARPSTISLQVHYCPWCGQDMRWEIPHVQRRWPRRLPYGWDYARREPVERVVFALEVSGPPGGPPGGPPSPGDVVMAKRLTFSTGTRC